MGMGLEDFVRGITADKHKAEKEEPQKSGADTESAAQARNSAKPGKGDLFDENLAKYTELQEQGVAVCLPKEVNKRLELIRANADRNIPLRALAAAITFPKTKTPSTTSNADIGHQKTENKNQESRAALRTS